LVGWRLLTTKGADIMKVHHHIVPLVISITIACTGAFVAATNHHPEVTPIATATQRHLPPLDSPSDNAAKLAHDAVALNDMRAHAILRLRNANIDKATFATNRDWTTDWELRWVDAAQDGEPVHVCHATHKRHPKLRFITTWDTTHSSWNEWEPVR
jgi:hypothetical protein